MRSTCPAFSTRYLRACFLELRSTRFSRSARVGQAKMTSEIDMLSASNEINRFRSSKPLRPVLVLKSCRSSPSSRIRDSSSPYTSHTDQPVVRASSSSSIFRTSVFLLLPMISALTHSVIINLFAENGRAWLDLVPVFVDGERLGALFNLIEGNRIEIPHIKTDVHAIACSKPVVMDMAKQAVGPSPRMVPCVHGIMRKRVELPLRSVPNLGDM